jgi:hypothetical protein
MSQYEERDISVLGFLKKYKSRHFFTVEILTHLRSTNHGKQWEGGGDDGKLQMCVFVFMRSHARLPLTCYKGQIKEHEMWTYGTLRRILNAYEILVGKHTS